VTRLFCILLFSLLPWQHITAQEALTYGPSGLPIPRFVSLSANKVNVRTGPGQQYPIEWVYVRRGYPVKVIAEYGNWRKIRDLDGTVGWILHSLLSGRRMAVILDQPRLLYAQASTSAPPVLKAEEGVIGQILRCQKGWCQLRISGLKGWISQKYIWGSLHRESIN